MRFYMPTLAALIALLLPCIRPISGPSPRIDLRILFYIRSVVPHQQVTAGSVGGKSRASAKSSNLEQFGATGKPAEPRVLHLARRAAPAPHMLPGACGAALWYPD